jgi:hypothetical protein
LAKENFELIQKSVSRGVFSRYSALILEGSMLDVQLCAHEINQDSYCFKRKKFLNEMAVVVFKKNQLGVISSRDVVSYQYDLIKVRELCAE